MRSRTPLPSPSGEARSRGPAWSLSSGCRGWPRPSPHSGDQTTQVCGAPPEAGAVGQASPSLEMKATAAKNIISEKRAGHVVAIPTRTKHNHAQRIVRKHTCQLPCGISPGTCPKSSRDQHRIGIYSGKTPRVQGKTENHCQLLTNVSSITRAMDVPSSKTRCIELGETPGDP
jgi:hypothetical protein